MHHTPLRGTPVRRSAAPVTPPSTNRRGSLGGGPRQRPNPLNFNEHLSSSPSPSQQVIKTSALAESILDESRMEQHAKRELEHDVLVGVKQELRDLANKLDANNWMFSSCNGTAAGLRL